MANNELITCKVVLVGETGVGKTAIISRYIRDTFNKGQEPSTMASYTNKEITITEFNTKLKLDIWDTAGQEKYRSLAKIFYKDAVVIILVYDITKADSFTEIMEYWLDEIKANSNKNAILALAANKEDLYNEATISEKEGQMYADTIGAIFKRTSALSNVGIDELFQLIGKKYLNPSYDYKAEEQKLKEEYMRAKMEGDDAFVPHDAGMKLNDTNGTTKKSKGKCGNCL